MSASQTARRGHILSGCSTSGIPLSLEVVGGENGDIYCLLLQSVMFADNSILPWKYLV